MGDSSINSLSLALVNNSKKQIEENLGHVNESSISNHFKEPCSLNNYSETNNNNIKIGSNTSAVPIANDDEDEPGGNLGHRAERRGPFICAQCKKEFRQHRDLDVHIRRQHSGERPFSCETCGKAYPAKSALRHHQKIHSERFVCHICGSAVVTETGLRKHMQIHEGTKPFSCEICSKSFMWKQSLLKHQVLHTNEKPYSCQICNKSFKISDYLQKHMNRKHPENNEGLILECSFCKAARFKTPGNLSAHILRKHSSSSASFVV